MGCFVPRSKGGAKQPIRGLSMQEPVALNFC